MLNLSLETKPPWSNLLQCFTLTICISKHLCRLYQVAPLKTLDFVSDDAANYISPVEVFYLCQTSHLDLADTYFVTYINRYLHNKDEHFRSIWALLLIRASPLSKVTRTGWILFINGYLGG